MPGRTDSGRLLVPANDTQSTSLVVVHSFGPGVGDSNSKALNFIPYLEFMLRLCVLPDADREDTLEVVDRPLDTQGETQVAVRALVERAVQTDSGLDGKDASGPMNLVGCSKSH